MEIHQSLVHWYIMLVAGAEALLQQPATEVHLEQAAMAANGVVLILV